ncbi:MAG: MFS transporter [Bacteroidia bacterium]|nr:MFS transporter [Bacteroidia bacterium]
MKAMLAEHPLLKFKEFRIFFAGRMLSSIGDKFFTITLAWWIISQGQENSKLHLGILMALNVLPVVLLGSAMGTLADRFSRKKCMQIANFIRFSLITALTLLFFTGSLSLPLLYVMVFFISTFVPLFESSAQSSLKDLSDEDSVSQVVALNSTSVYLSNILGAMMGGIMIAAIGIGWALGFNAICYFFSFLLISFISLDYKQGALKEKFSEQFRQGFRFLRKNKSILYMLLIFASLNLFAAPLTLLIPMIVKFELNETARWLAFLDGSFATGAGITAIVLSFRKSYNRIYLTIFLALLAMGLTMVMVGLTALKFVMISEFLVIGATLAITNAIVISLFQHNVPDDIKGRFFSLQVSIATAVIPLAYLLNGMMAQYALPILFIPRISNKI